MYSLYVIECSNFKTQFQTSLGLYTVLTALVVPKFLAYRFAGILKVASLESLSRVTGSLRVTRNNSTSYFDELRAACKLLE